MFYASKTHALEANTAYPVLLFDTPIDIDNELSIEALVKKAVHCTALHVRMSAETEDLGGYVAGVNSRTATLVNVPAYRAMNRGVYYLKGIGRMVMPLVSDISWKPNVNSYASVTDSAFCAAKACVSLSQPTSAGTSAEFQAVAGPDVTWWDKRSESDYDFIEVDFGTDVVLDSIHSIMYAYSGSTVTETTWEALYQNDSGDWVQYAANINFVSGETSARGLSVPIRKLRFRPKISSTRVYNMRLRFKLAAGFEPVYTDELKTYQHAVVIVNSKKVAQRFLSEGDADYLGIQLDAPEFEVRDELLRGRPLHIRSKSIRMDFGSTV